MIKVHPNNRNHLDTTLMAGLDSSERQNALWTRNRDKFKEIRVAALNFDVPSGFRVLPPHEYYACSNTAGMGYIDL